jgi:hypothetical protein
MLPGGCSFSGAAADRVDQGRPVMTLQASREFWPFLA